MRMMFGRMFLRSLWMRPLRPWALVVVKAKLPGDQSRDNRANQGSHCISMMSETTEHGMDRSDDYWRWWEGERGPARPLTHTRMALAALVNCEETYRENRDITSQNDSQWEADSLKEYQRVHQMNRVHLVTNHIQAQQFHPTTGEPKWFFQALALDGPKRKTLQFHMLHSDGNQYINSPYLKETTWS